jgi:hypothetical protein
MTDAQDKALRQQLVEYLEGGWAHAKFDNVVPDTPVTARGQKAAGMPHSPWMIIEHLRIAQWDILEFSRNAKHKSPKWPEGYWPKTEAPPSADDWDKSIEQFRKELKMMQDLVADPNTDLFAKIPWGEKQTVLREALTLADHNAYHLAQIVDVRRALGAWEKS